MRAIDGVSFSLLSSLFFMVFTSLAFFPRNIRGVYSFMSLFVLILLVGIKLFSRHPATLATPWIRVKLSLFDNG